MRIHAHPCCCSRRANSRARCAGDLDKKLGAPLASIHAPVPGFETELNGLINKTFDNLQPGMPVWRARPAPVCRARLARDPPSVFTAEPQAQQLAAG